MKPKTLDEAISYIAPFVTPDDRTFKPAAERLANRIAAWAAKHPDWDAQKLALEFANYYLSDESITARTIAAAEYRRRFAVAKRDLQREGK
jgi:hypothetical protein